jgi:hypothetical protein
MRRGAPISAREALELITQLPDSSAFISSLRAAAPSGPDEEESTPPTEAQRVLRKKRDWRSWGSESTLLADVRDILAGPRSKPARRPWDDSPGSNRQVLEIDELPNF